MIISTPDHWHVPMSLMALAAGKHVFSEKPTLTMTEGRQLTEAVRKSGKVFQWGIEDRSLIKYWLLSGLARTGAIGEIQNVYCDLPAKPTHYKIEQPIPVPDYLDWNLWLGPAPVADYTENVLDPQRWRQNDAYSGGSLTDWGSHLCDTAQVGIGMDDSGPIAISGTGKEMPADSYVTAPAGFEIKYRYANGAAIIVDSSKPNLRFEGSKGWIECKQFNGKLDASDRNILRDKTLGENPNFWPRPEFEHKDFIAAIMDRSKTPTYHPEAGHRLASMLHLGHLAVKKGKTVHWNPEQEQFTKDAAEMKASKIYDRTARDWQKGL